MTFQAWHIMCFVFCSRVFDVLSTYPFTMPCLQICKSGPIAQVVPSFTKQKKTKDGRVPTDGDDLPMEKSLSRILS